MPRTTNVEGQEEIQKLTDRYVAMVDTLLKDQEAEIIEFSSTRSALSCSASRIVTAVIFATAIADTICSLVGHGGRCLGCSLASRRLGMGRVREAAGCRAGRL